MKLFSRLRAVFKPSLVQGGAVYLIQHINARGEMVHSDTELVHNLVPVQGLTHIAGVVFKQVTQVANWYLALFEGNYTPLPTATAATIAAASTETVAYDETSRVLFQSGAVDNGAVDNTAALAEFTFNTTKTIYGGYMVSSSPKAGTTGTLISLIRFASPKQVEDGSVLRITSGFAFSST